jgi:AmmeMemoRadiSam system protein A
MLSECARKEIACIVAEALSAALNGESYAPPEPQDPVLGERRGCFVTLKTEGQLRGCLGCFTSDLPLAEAVAKMTRDSALEDPRFAGRRLRPEDLPRITFDVSVLTPLEPCNDPENIELGVHGIYVRQGLRAGCFLPQVATEIGWSVEEFWSNCCSHKAGLTPDAWRGGDIELFTFTADIVEGQAGEQ